MIKKYGSHNGFGWKHNEVIGAQIVNVPMELPIARADKTFTAFMIILVLRSLYREKSLREQIVAAMVLVPLLLRVLMIK